VHQTWYDYRLVWAQHPWVLVYAVIVTAVFVLAVVGTALAVVPLAILFVPSLAGVYVHHIMVARRLPS
jgi:hypothetical protein